MWLCIAGAVLAAFVPHAVLGWSFDVPVIVLGLIFGPVLFLVFIVAAYRSSGRDRRVWLLLLLTPVALWWPLQTVAAVLIWSIRGIGP